MAYPSFNLATIQLPAPTSSMTKAEYKTAFGIDLNAVNIKSFKLVIFGNDKYAIEQIKEVEHGYEIYFNGRILSITDTIETSDEVYDVANSKPLYFHPVILNDSTLKLGLAMIIINNSPTSLNTWDKVKAFLFSVMTSIGDTARFPATGSFFVDGESITCRNIDVTTANVIKVYGYASDGTSKSLDIQNTLIVNVYDGVNKIN